MANNSKQIWMTILIAVIVGILSSAITVSVISKNVLLGPQESLKIIKANSCDADSKCEVNALKSFGTVTTNLIESEGDLQLTSSGGGRMVFAPDRPTVSLEKGNLIIEDGVIHSNALKAAVMDENRHFTLYIGNEEDPDYEHAPTASIRLLSPVTAIGDYFIIEKLKGNETAYVCANQKGSLYRSLAPCR